MVDEIIIGGKKMKKTYFLIWGVILSSVCAVRADLQMDFYGSGYNSGYTITGSDGGSFELYLRLPHYSSIRGEGWGVQITDLSSALQGHLYHIAGIDGSVFWCDGYPLLIEVYDLSNSIIGIFSDLLTPSLLADAGGPYVISPGQSVNLDCSNSYFVGRYGWNPASSLQPLFSLRTEWKIDGIRVGDRVSELITFDYLVNTLGLGYGVHNIELFAEGYDSEELIWSGGAYSTIEIVPEPATMLLLGLGGIALARRRS